MIVKTIFVIKHAFGPFEVDSIGPVSETTNDIRNRISTGIYMLATTAGEYLRPETAATGIN